MDDLLIRRATLRSDPLDAMFGLALADAIGVGQRCGGADAQGSIADAPLAGNVMTRFGG